MDVVAAVPVADAVVVVVVVVMSAFACSDATTEIAEIASSRVAACWTVVAVVSDAGAVDSAVGSVGSAVTP